MRKIIKNMLLMALLGAMGAVSVAQAQVTPLIGGFYAGAALAHTRADAAGTDSGLGSHLYGGLDLFSIPLIARFGLEAGYLRTNRIHSEAGHINNFSGSAMASLIALPVIDLHARVGYEDGDTSGVFQAVGVTFRPFPVLGIRGEYSRNNGFDAMTLGLRLRVP